MSLLRSTVAGVAIVCAIGSIAPADVVASAAPPIPLDTPRFIRAGDFATDVTIRWTERPSRRPGSEVDPGPSVAGGEVEIVSGAERTRTIVSFSTLSIAPPNIAQTIPIDATTACGAAGPIAIVPLSRSVAPAVIVTSVAIGKGCLPIRHILLPIDDRSRHFRPIALYAFTGTPRTAPIDASPSKSIRVLRARTIELPDPLKNAPAIEPRKQRIVVLDGRDGADRAVTIVVGPGLPQTTQLERRVLFLAAGANGFPGSCYVAPPRGNRAF